MSSRNERTSERRTSEDEPVWSQTVSHSTHPYSPRPLVLLLLERTCREHGQRRTRREWGRGWRRRKGGRGELERFLLLLLLLLLVPRRRSVRASSYPDRVVEDVRPDGDEVQDLDCALEVEQVRSRAQRRGLPLLLLLLLLPPAFVAPPLQSHRARPLLDRAEDPPSVEALGGGTPALVGPAELDF